ncbi:MAG TPA: hypothetical protein VIM10_05975 [Actinopolymorphaceae bacterium]|jgi:hypothetical protein
MGATARLSDKLLRVDCGKETLTTVTVRNTGAVVDEFTFVVLGEPAAWTTVEPASLSLFPDGEGTVSVRFSPSRDATTRQGTMPFGVRVSSREDAVGSVVEEGNVDVVPFVELSAELVPHTSHGRRSATHEVAVDNRGNASAEVTLAATDPDSALRFRFTRPVLSAAPGTASFSKVRVSAHRLLWRGTPQSVPFAVTVTPVGQPPIRLDASFQRQPMIAAWIPRTIAVLFVLVLASVAVWKGILQPQVVKTVANAPAVQTANRNIQQVADETGVKLATPAPSSSASPTPTDATGAGGAGGAGVTTALGNAVSVPVSVEVAPGTVKTVVLAFPGSSPTFTVASVLVQNPFNDAGIIAVQRIDAAHPDDPPSNLIRQSLFNQANPSVALTPPVALVPGDTLQVRITCTQPGAIPRADTTAVTPNQNCNVGVLVGGYVRGATAGPTPTVLPPGTTP